MKASLWSWAIGWFTFTAIFVPAARVAAEPGSNRFRTTHVTLYDCGLAQLERTARVKGAQKLTVDVTRTHLDDLLASLVFATDDSVSIKSVTYPGVRNLGQSLAASGLAGRLATEDQEVLIPSDLAALVRALVGTEVTVIDNKGKQLRGTVLTSAAQHRAADNDSSEENDKETNKTSLKPSQNLVLIAPDGSLQWVPLQTILRVKPASSREGAAIDDFATQLGGANGLASTSVTVQTAAQSRGLLAMSYVRQIPLWRMLYRVTLAQDKILLEAWAVVHNDTDEQWREVQMTLISGLPTSYVLSLASPRYAVRDFFVFDEQGGMTPQLGANTSDSLLRDGDPVVHDDSEGSSFGFGGLGMRGTGRGGGGVGRGTIGAGRLGTAGESSSSLLTIGESAASIQMTAAVEREIATYRALNRVTVPARTSSLVPVMRREVPGLMLTLVERSKEPSTCVRVQNNTGLVLQPGLGSFYRDGLFRGESELSRTEPGDVGIWCFGRDPDVTFEVNESIQRTHRSVQWINEKLVSHQVKQTDLDFSIKNMAGQKRRIAIAIDHIDNGRVISPKKTVAGNSANRKLYIFEMEARSGSKPRVVIEEAVQKTMPLSKLPELASAASLPKNQREVLARARSLWLQRKELQEKVEIAKNKIEAQKQIMARQRKNLESIGDAKDRALILKPFILKILGAEKTIQSLQRRLDHLVITIQNNQIKTRDTLAELRRWTNPATR